jgi:hypothetical protein
MGTTALSRHHKGHLIEVARVINALTDQQRAELGIERHDRGLTYDRAERTFTKLAEVLDAGYPGIEAKWFANALAEAAIPEEFRQSRIQPRPHPLLPSQKARRGRSQTDPTKAPPRHLARHRRTVNRHAGGGREPAHLATRYLALAGCQMAAGFSAPRVQDQTLDAKDGPIWGRLSVGPGVAEGVNPALATFNKGFHDHTLRCFVIIPSWDDHETR